MKKRSQIIILIVISVIIGIAIGFLVNGRLVSHRIDKMRSQFNDTGFGREIMHIIKPTKEQKEQLIPLFRNYAEQNRELMQAFHDDQNALFNDLLDELDEVLTPEQIERLTNYQNNRKHRLNKHIPKPDRRSKANKRGQERGYHR